MTKEPRKLGPKIKREKDQIVSINIKKYRTLIGMSQEGLAKELNLTFQQIQKYERAANRVSAGTLFEIAIIFGIPVAWLFYTEEDWVKAVNGDVPGMPVAGATLFTEEEVGFIRLLRKQPEKVKERLYGLMDIL